MTEFSFETTPAAREYCESILAAMVSLFGINREEAVLRMNRHWHGQRLTEEDDLRSLTRELPDYWARRIYFGPDAKWWLPGADPQAIPLDDET